MRNRSMLLPNLSRNPAKRLISIEALESRELLTVNAWKTAISGDWTDATKWSLKHVPTSTEDVTITAAGSYTVKHATSAVNQAKSLTVSSNLELDSGTISVAGTVKITAGSLTFKGGTLAKATLSTTGTGKVTTTTTTGALDGVTLASSITMATGTSLNLRHTTTFSNNSKLFATNGHVFMQDSTDTGAALAGTGEVVLTGSSGSILSGDLAHAHPAALGSEVLIDGAGQVNFSSAVNSATIMSNLSGRTLALSGTFSNKGTVKATNAATLQIKNPSTFTNQGTISASAGVVLISGSFKAGAGTLAVGIGGTTLGSNYGVINVAGALTFGGTLSVSLLGSYIPSSSAKFTVLEFTSFSGSFATKKLTSGSTTFTGTPVGTSLILNVAPVIPTLSLGYTTLQIATNQSFTTGVQTITLSSTGSNNIALKAGQFFRFGMTATVTGSPNPAFNGAWDKANQKVNGKPAQPAALGLGLLFMKLLTTNDSAAVVVPVAAKAGGTMTTAVIGPTKTPQFTTSSSGDINGGDVGTNFQIGGGFFTADPTTASGVAQLAGFVQSDVLFSNLIYRARGAGHTVIAPLVDTTAVLFWSNSGVGTVDSAGNPVNDATYRQSYDPKADVIKNAAPINITAT